MFGYWVYKIVNIGAILFIIIVVVGGIFNAVNAVNKDRHTIKNEPTQKSSGYKTYKCLKCGAERKGKYVENFDTSNCAMGGEHEFVEEWKWKIKNRKAN